MFDTIFGLPWHALVVHGTVVLLPLSALLTAAVAWWPAARARVAWPVVGLDAAMVVLVFITIKSGETFQRRLGGQVALEHGEQGKLLLPFAVGLLVAALLMALAPRIGPGAQSGAGVLSVLVALLIVVWTVRTGHSGASEVWGPVVDGTQAP